MRKHLVVLALAAILGWTFAMGLHYSRADDDAPPPLKWKIIGIAHIEGHNIVLSYNLDAKHLAWFDTENECNEAREHSPHALRTFAFVAKQAEEAGGTFDTVKCVQTPQIEPRAYYEHPDTKS